MLRLGLLGGKLGHSLSPRLHDAALAHNRLPGEYRLYETEAAGLPAYLHSLRTGALHGLNVTIPHKRAVYALLDALSPQAQRAGAVNTLVCRAGELSGHNTDVDGLRDLLTHFDLARHAHTATVLGTGGMARAAVVCLQDMGSRDICVVSRAGGAIAGVHTLGYAQLPPRRGGLLVNCTPVGMFPNAGYSPLTDTQVAAFDAVVDTIYNPARTALLAQAASAGLPYANGLYLLCAQGVRALQLWAGKSLRADTVDAVYTALAKETAHG